MFHLFEKIKQNGVYIIAEISANHAGKIENALQIVREAARIGADCVKIQTYTADTITIDCDNKYFKIKGGLWDGYKLHDLYKEASTPYEWHKAIKEECEKCGVDFLSTPFDFTAVDFLEELGVEAFKIASFELVDIPLIEYVAKNGKPMIISCGMGSKSEIREAIKACERVGNKQIVLLKCCSDYPANWDEMHVANIVDMKKTFKTEVGLSDHSMGSLAAVVAVSSGATVIEKHICLSRAISNPDSAFSMEIEEFGKMVKDVHDAIKIKGKVKYGPNPGEKKNLRFRRSLFAVKDIQKGEQLTKDNIRSIRPSNGMAPKYYNNILGKTSSQNIKKGTPLKWKMIAK